MIDSDGPTKAARKCKESCSGGQRRKQRSHRNDIEICGSV